MKIDKDKYEEVFSATVETILKDYFEFKSLVKKTGRKINKSATREFLIFLLFWAVDNFQKWRAENKELDLLVKTFYDEAVDKKIVEREDLLEFERESRKRWLYFYEFLGEKHTINENYSEKAFSVLIAKEALYIDRLLSGFKPHDKFSEPPQVSDESLKSIINLQAWVSGLLLQTSLSMLYLTQDSS